MLVLYMMAMAERLAQVEERYQSLWDTMQQASAERMKGKP